MSGCMDVHVFRLSVNRYVHRESIVFYLDRFVVVCSRMEGQDIEMTASFYR